MALPGCSISVGVDGQQALVRLEGRLAVESAPAFEKVILRLRSGGVGCVVLDLSGALLMDSGFSGTLTRLVATGGISFALHGAPQRILDGLEDHGVLDLVGVLEAGSTSAPTRTVEVPMEAPARADVLRCCLDAHRALMALKPENVAKFQTVEAFLSREVGKLAEVAAMTTRSG